MARRRRRGRRRREPVSTWLMVGGIFAIVAFFGYIYITDTPPPKVDPRTLCPEESSQIPHLEVLLFERNRRTDSETKQFSPISPNVVLEIRREVESHLDTLPKYSLVEIYEVNYSSSEQFRPVARFCNPGDGSDLSELTGNPRLAKQRYRERFRDPFNRIVESMSAWSPDNRYGLVDSLGGIARLVLGNPEFDHASKSLIVVSDFVVPQNFIINGKIPNSFSDVPTSVPLGSFDEFVGAGGLRFDFRGAEVRLIIQRVEYAYIPDIQGAPHISWWERFFDAQNATVEEVARVGEW